MPASPACQQPDGFTAARVDARRGIYAASRATYTPAMSAISNTNSSPSAVVEMPTVVEAEPGEDLRDAREPVPMGGNSNVLFSLLERGALCVDPRPRVQMCNLEFGLGHRRSRQREQSSLVVVGRPDLGVVEDGEDVDVFGRAEHRVA